MESERLLLMTDAQDSLGYHSKTYILYTFFVSEGRYAECRGVTEGGVSHRGQYTEFIVNRKISHLASLAEMRQRYHSTLLKRPYLLVLVDMCGSSQEWYKGVD